MPTKDLRRNFILSFLLLEYDSTHFYFLKVSHLNMNMNMNLFNHNNNSADAYAQLNYCVCWIVRLARPALKTIQ